jgi:hypothetical protein
MREGTRISDDLFFRIAKALDWTVNEVRGFSPQYLREIVKPVSSDLAQELTDIIEARERALQP